MRATKEPASTGRRNGPSTRPGGAADGARHYIVRDASNDPSLAAIEEALWTAAEARAQVLEALSSDEIVEIVAAAAEVWRKPHYGPRRQTIDELSRALGLAPAMLAAAIDARLARLGRRDLGALIASQVEVPEALDAPVPRPDGSLRRLAGPPMVFHILPSGTPDATLPIVAVQLLARSIGIIRNGGGTHGLTDAFTATIGEYAPELAGMIIPARWASGEGATERYVLDQAPRIEVTSWDACAARLAALRLGSRLVQHREGICLAWIPGESDTDRWASPLAEQIAMLDGRSSLSPHVVLVEGSQTRARRMAKALGVALERLERIWPHQRKTRAVERLRDAFTESARVAATYNPARDLISGRRQAWALDVNPGAPIAAGPGGRCATVVALADRRETAAALAEAEAPLGAVALGLERDDPHFAGLEDFLLRAGATLVHVPGEFRAPPLGWESDGSRRLADLLDWTSDEEL